MCYSIESYHGSSFYRELISYVTTTDNRDDTIKRFSDVMEEIFTHPRQTITDNLIHISTNHTAEIRSHLYSTLTHNPTPDLKAELATLNITNENKVSRLCKRYNETKNYNDIYLLGISIVDNKLHKDFKDLITLSTKKKEKRSPSPALYQQSPSRQRKQWSAAATVQLHQLERVLQQRIFSYLNYSTIPNPLCR